MGALSADSSLVSAQAAFKIYLYHPLERLQFFIIIVPKWALSHAGPSPSILSPSRALSFLCHLPDYRELNREKGGGYWGGVPQRGWDSAKWVSTLVPGRPLAHSLQGSDESSRGTP